MFEYYLTLTEFLDKTFNNISIREKGFYSLIIAFLPTIIAISYPIIIQTITKLNELYSSTQILNLFKQEKLHINFKNCLIVSLILSGLTFLNYEMISIVAFLFIILLIVIYINYINLILKYSNPSDLFSHIINKIDISPSSIKEDSNEVLSRKYNHALLKFHEIITDIYCYSIKLEDITLETNIKQKYFYQISSLGKSTKAKDKAEISFESIIFNSNFRILETYIKYSGIETRYKNLEFFSTEFYLPYSLGTNGPTPFDSQTFVSIWNNIILLTKVKNYKKLKAHWKIIHNYYNLYLRRSYLEYDIDSKVTKSSFEKNQQIIVFKEKIIELNISFLAVLYYKKKYKIIEELIFHTQNFPPKPFLYEFGTQDTLDYYHESLKDIFEKNWDIIYYFDDLEFDSIGFQKDSKYYISEFCLVLFLFSWINDYGSSLRENIQPLSIPSDLPTQKLYSGRIPFIIKQIEKILNNKNLINKTSLSKINRRECFLKGIKHPIDYLLEFKQQLDFQSEERLVSGDLDPEKIKLLIDSTVSAIKNAYTDVCRISGLDINKEERDEISNFMETIRGTNMPLSREALLTDPTVHFVDFDKRLGRYIRDNYYAHLIDKLELLVTKNYNVEFKEIFKAVDLLNLNEHIIIAANLNLEYLSEYLNIGLLKSGDQDNDYSYNGIPIYSYDGGSHRKGKLYILRNIDKPMIKHKDWKEIKKTTPEFRSRWEKMTPVSKELHIYFEMRELFNNPTLLEKYKENSSYTDDELNKMIEFGVDFLGYCWFPKKVKIISISQGDFYQQGGDLDQLNTIKPFL